MTRTPVACLSWLIQTHFKTLGNSSYSSRKQIYTDILGIFFLFYHENPFCVLSESPQWGNSTENTQHRYNYFIVIRLIVLGFNDTSTLEGHFVLSPREREKRNRRESRGDEREGQGRKRNRNESEETEEMKTFPLYPYPLQG